MSNSTLDRVVRCIAVATRYPSQLLTPDADLENDLGIDSVKLLEIVMALADEFGIELASNDRDSSIRTIQNVAGWIEGLISGGSEGDELQQETDFQTAVKDRRGSIAASNGPKHQADELVVTKVASESTMNDASMMQSPAMSSVRTSSSENLNAGANERNFSESSSSGKKDSGDEVRWLHHSASPHPQRPHFASSSNGSSGARTEPLSGRVALVTGSGRGVGRTIARVLASRGATVIVNSFHSRDQGEEAVSEIQAAGGKAVHYWGSVANPHHVDQIFTQIEDNFGRLDMLVCNASDGRIGSFIELTSDDWDRAFRTNVMGHHHCAVKAAPLMRANGGGSIITMSAVGSNGFIAGLGSQGVVKAAVETMTRYLACELGRYGIRANCVVGGPIYGELLSKFPDARSTQNHWESLTADGELCSPIDLANAIAFLVSDQARGINGSVWAVDHGFTAVADGRTIPMMQSAGVQNVN